MRILDYYDIKNKRINKKLFLQGLWHDIECLANHQFKNDPFKKFRICIKLTPLHNER